MTVGQDAAAQSIEEQHAAILATCDALLAAIGSARAMEAVGKLRGRLSALLHANLVVEERDIIGPIRNLPLQQRPRLFTELSLDAADLRRRYSEHVGRWTLKDIEQAPAQYHYAAAALVRDVKAHVARKRTVLSEWRRAAEAAGSEHD